MRHTLIALAVASGALASAASGASITTVFNSNNNGSTGGGIYFQIVVGANPINITGLSTNTGAIGAGQNIPLRVFTAATTHVGNEANAGAWTLVATGTGTGAGLNLPTVMNLSNSIALAANTSYGIALSLSSAAGGATFSHFYSGTGANPAPGALQYTNSDVTLNLGSANNVLFTAPQFSPRVWNGTITYDVVPAPGAAALMAIAGLAGARRRR